MRASDLYFLPVASGSGGDTHRPATASGQQSFGDWLAGGEPGPGEPGQEHGQCAHGHGPGPALPKPCLEPSSKLQGTPVHVQVRLPHAAESQVSSALYEWELQSQKSLSYLMQGHGNLETDVGSGPSGKDVWGMRPFQEYTSVGPDIAIDPCSGPTGNVDGADLQVGREERPASERNVAMRSGEDALARMALPSPWAERLIRILEKADQTIVVWLRDYRLDDSQMSSMVGDILEAYGGADTVSRIVVNGTEVWCRPLRNLQE